MDFTKAITLLVACPLIAVMTDRRMRPLDERLAIRLVRVAH